MRDDTMLDLESCSVSRGEAFAGLCFMTRGWIRSKMCTPNQGKCKTNLGLRVTQRGSETASGRCVGIGRNNGYRLGEVVGRGRRGSYCTSPVQDDERARDSPV